MLENPKLRLTAPWAQFSPRTLLFTGVLSDQPDRDPTTGDVTNWSYVGQLTVEEFNRIVRAEQAAFARHQRGGIL